MRKSETTLKFSSNRPIGQISTSTRKNTYEIGLLDVRRASPHRHFARGNFLQKRPCDHARTHRRRLFQRHAFHAGEGTGFHPGNYQRR